MKEAIKYLNQYADEVEDEGLNSLADEIRECAISLKALDPNAPELPRPVVDSPDVVEYNDERWIRESASRSTEGALRSKITALESEIDRQRGKRGPDVQWGQYADPETMDKIHEIRVKFRTSWALDHAFARGDQFALQSVLESVAAEFRKIQKSLNAQSVHSNPPASFLNKYQRGTYADV